MKDKEFVIEQKRRDTYYLHQLKHRHENERHDGFRKRFL